MKAAILVPRLTPYDAISIDAWGSQAVLQKLGFDCRLFAESWDDLAGVKHIKELPAFKLKDQDLLLVHISASWPAALEMIPNCSAQVVLRYHNITPAHFFKPWNNSYSTACRQGRLELQEWVRWLPQARWLAVSQLNRSELTQLGARQVAVLPVFNQSTQLLQIEADLDFLHSLGNAEMTNILFVGRIVPNKGLEFLLESFAIYNRQINSHSNLFLAGSLDPQLQNYQDHLQELIEQLGIANRVVFTGSLDRNQIKSCYLAATVFVTTSEHEGFCVPLLEAQALQVPVLARQAGAIGETMAEGGLLWPADCSAAVIAASMHHITQQSQLTQSLQERGRQNYLKRFTQTVIEKQFCEYIKSIQQDQSR